MTAEPAPITTFYSSRAGVGRTRTIAGVARLLAADGAKVLVVEEEHESRELRRCLRLTGQKREWSVEGGPSGALTAVRHDGEGSIDVLTVRGVVPPGRSTPEDFAVRARVLRDGLRGGGYDHVLVDAPSDEPPSTELWTVLIPDTVVICFTVGPRAVGEGAANAKDIVDRAERPIKVIPVMMLVDAGAGDELRQAREHVRDMFRWPAGVLIEIPYLPFDNATGAGGGSLAAYRPVAQAVADREPAPVPVAEPSGVLVVRAPQDRVWAEWISAQLRHSGIDTLDVMPDRCDQRWNGKDPHVLIVVSRFTPHGVGGVARLVERCKAAAGTGGDPKVSVVKVDKCDLGPELAGLPLIDLRERGAVGAFGALRDRLGFSAPVPCPPPPRYPARPVEHRLPGRNHGFVGRDAILESLRDKVLEGTLARPVVISGDAGVGKSQIALEFAHRFAPAYDYVAWLPAEQRHGLRASLGEYAVAGKLPTGSDAARALLDHLEAGAGGKRWLLIYDNAENPAAVEDLLPAESATCDVIITSQSGDWGTRRRVPLGPFLKEESLTLIRRHLPGLADREATRMAAAAKQMPLAVELGAAWTAARLTPLTDDRSLPTSLEQAADQFLTAIRERSRRLAQTTSPFSAEYRAVLALALDGLREGRGGPAGVWLLTALSLLSGEGLSARLLYAPSIRALLARAEERPGQHTPSRLADTFLIDVVLRDIEVRGLARLESGASPGIVMHRLLQQMIQAAMTDAELAATRAEVLTALAGCAPTDAEGVHGWHEQVLSQLADHLEPSGALDSDDPAVAEWVVKQVRHFWGLNDQSGWERAKEIGERADARWKRHPALAAGLRPRLLIELANAYRDLGLHEKAAVASGTALDAQRADRALGPEHPRTLMTQSGHAANERARGRFEAAHIHDEAVLGGLSALFGDDHTHTVRAMNNRALSALLWADPVEALEFAQDAHERLRQRFGDQDPVVCWLACGEARYHRDLGDYEKSSDLVRKAAAYLRDQDLRARDLREQSPAGQDGASGEDETGRPMVGDPMDSLGALRAQNALAVTERLLGRTVPALNRREKVLAKYLAFQGPRQQGTLSCALSLAADLYAVGRHADAVRQAERALADYEQVFAPDHPFTVVCRVNLAVYVAGAGDEDRSAILGAEALARMRESFGDMHVFTQAAAMNHAGTLVRLGRLDEALALDEDCHQILHNAFGPANHIVRLAETNQKDTRVRMSRRDADDGWSRAHIDLEMPEI
ncbi:FxSxx-COOH system tetratricopeptide repeat protein [Sphaerisporangium aureirubrum]|uniref:FxSxx-COOH system tetratricopeptide repeat protein n=1 Tax=Sphaerisporangium aureirubrum TaxID=1544736 RepID=A0ABW1NRP9_9ACTN